LFFFTRRDSGERLDDPALLGVRHHHENVPFVRISIERAVVEYDLPCVTEAFQKRFRDLDVVSAREIPTASRLPVSAGVDSYQGRAHGERPPAQTSRSTASIASRKTRWCRSMWESVVRAKAMHRSASAEVGSIAAASEPNTASAIASGP
jgi:hypothetical protein